MKLKDLVIIAMFAALISAMGIIPPIPMPGLPVPIVLQNLGIMLAGCLLGRKKGTFAVLLFLLLAAVGAPVLSGGRGGFALFFGPTGGYLLSYIIVAYLIGLATDKMRHFSVWKVFIVNVFIGAIICNLIGGAFMAQNLKMDLMKAYTSVLVFLPGDFIKALLAALLAVSLRKNPQIKRSLNI